MALVVNSNIASLNAQRQLNTSTQSLDQASERLASGQRINSAADDAAGLAISNRQTSQIRGLDQAIRNANDGASLIQTAEGALQESTSILQRMRELAVQSSNGIYSDSDRNTLDAEVQQLVQELDRISETTSFNGQNILDGSAGNIELQIGANAGQSISFNIAETSTKSLGLGSTTSDITGSNIDDGLSIDDGDVLINGQALAAYDEATDNLDDLVKDINDNVAGVTAQAVNVFEATSAADGIVTATQSFDIVASSTDGTADTTFTIGGSADATTENVEELAALINDKTGGAVTASVNEDNGRLVLSNDTGGTLEVNNFTGVTASNIGFASGAPQTGSLALSSDDGEPVTITTGASGTDADLAALGFNEVDGQGSVTGATVSASNQIQGFSTGDLKINGTIISGEDTASLQGKVDSINLETAQTGVVASITAKESFTPNFDDYNELTITSVPFILTSSLDLNGTQINFSAANFGVTLDEAADAFNAESASTGATAFVNEEEELIIASSSPLIFSSGSANFDFVTGTRLDGSSILPADFVHRAQSLSGVAGSVKLNNNDIVLNDIGDINSIVTDINAASGITGVQVDIDSNGELEFSSSSGFNFELGNDNGFASSQALGLNFTNTETSTSVDARIQLDSINDSAISVELADTNTALITGLKDFNTSLSSVASGSAISNISISTVLNAQDAIGSIDSALETINDTRSQLGAVSNRLDFTISNLSNVSENTSAARSRVVDADFAAETAALSRAQILQQASQSILAQANARPQQVLSLLQ